jgi:hypothetical protein
MNLWFLNSGTIVITLYVEIYLPNDKKYSGTWIKI